MPAVFSTLLIYSAAAAFEIAGCYAVWMWLRLEKSPLWLFPAALALGIFAYLLTLAPSDYAGRAYAAYGGIYILASIVWIRFVEQKAPDNWDLLGAGLAVIGAAIILFAPRN